jgi:hypothetical protein
VPLYGCGYLPLGRPLSGRVATLSCCATLRLRSVSGPSTPERPPQLQLHAIGEGGVAELGCGRCQRAQKGLVAKRERSLAPVPYAREASHRCCSTLRSLPLRRTYTLQSIWTNDPDLQMIRLEKHGKSISSLREGQVAASRTGHALHRRYPTPLKGLASRCHAKLVHFSRFQSSQFFFFVSDQSCALSRISW